MPVGPADQERHDGRAIVPDTRETCGECLAGERLAGAVERHDIGALGKPFSSAAASRSRPASPPPPARTSRTSSGHGSRLR